MRFHVAHEFDAPLDVVELAVLSPDLGPRLARSLALIESIETVEHVIANGELRRVLRFQANVFSLLKGPSFLKDVMSWHESSKYRLVDHASTWKVTPRDEWKRYFRSEGTYRLEAVADGRTRRVVAGDLEVRAALFSSLAERMAIAEVKKTYDAEADTLRELATL